MDGSMLEFLRDQLRLAREARTAMKAAAEGTIATAKAEKRALKDDEKTALSAKMDELRAKDAEVDDYLAKIAEAEAAERREAAHGQASADAGQTGERREGGARIGAEPTAYGQTRRHSYFIDLARDQLGRGDGDGGVQAARERLSRHAAELVVEMPKREARRAQLADQALGNIEGLRPEQRSSVFERGLEQRVNPNRVDGQGGYFVPPLWLIDQYIALARFGRQTANLCHNMPLPTGTDSINLPKVATGTAVAVQAADAGAVNSQDMTDTFVNAPVRTLAGQEDVALQLLDQSPLAFDEIVFADLMADYNMKLDIQVLAGTGANGQHTGILNVGGINAITYTDASPTFPKMYPSFAQGASKIYKNRKLPATAAVVLPSIWYAATAQVDTTGRPLIVPPMVAFNSMSTITDVANGDGPAGMLSLGLPAYMDGNLPINLGAGTNETRNIVARWSDLYLWEGALQTRVLQEVLSGTLQVRFQVYAYSAFMANRRPESVSVVSGTGMIPDANY